MNNILFIADTDDNYFNDLSRLLSSKNYIVINCNTTNDAWDVLATNDNINLIYIDIHNITPDNLEFAKNVKSKCNLEQIPLLISTTEENIMAAQEELQHGGVVCIARNMPHVTLLSVIKNALYEYTHKRNLQKQLHKFSKLNSLVNDCNLEVRTLEEADAVAVFLSNLYPRPMIMVNGIIELIFNGIEHGNLALSYDEKTELIKAEKWEEEILKRLAMPEYMHKKVKIEFICEPDKYVLTISDEGKGFDWKKYMKMSNDRINDPNGRGIAIANQIAFDEINYKGCGNTVEAIVYRK